MEHDILDQLYFGEIVPWENGNDQTPELIPVKKQVSSDIEHLKKRLDEEGNRILERILDNSADLETHVVCEGFKDGFRLGVQLTAAGMGSRKQS